MGRKMKKGTTNKKEKLAKAVDPPKEETDDAPATEETEQVEDAQSDKKDNKKKSSSENGVEDKTDEVTSTPATTSKGKRKSGAAKSKENGVEAEESTSAEDKEVKGGRKRGRQSKSSKPKSEVIPTKRSKREVKKPDLFKPNQEKEKEWEVVEIVQKREKQGQKEYLVRWKGFKLSDATWEPESNLLNCKRLLEKFNSK